MDELEKDQLYQVILDKLVGKAAKILRKAGRCTSWPDVISLLHMDFGVVETHIELINEASTLKLRDCRNLDDYYDRMSTIIDKMNSRSIMENGDTFTPDNNEEIVLNNLKAGHRALLTTDIKTLCQAYILLKKQPEFSSRKGERRHANEGIHKNHLSRNFRQCGSREQVQETSKQDLIQPAKFNFTTSRFQNQPKMQGFARNLPNFASNSRYQPPQNQQQSKNYDYNRRDNYFNQNNHGTQVTRSDTTMLSRMDTNCIQSDTNVIDELREEIRQLRQLVSENFRISASEQYQDH